MVRVCKLRKQDTLLKEISVDILLLLKIAIEVGWGQLNRNAISRILYITSVCYLFRYDNKNNPFSKYINFSVNLRGPYSEQINDALVYLVSFDYIVENDESFSVNRDFSPNLTYTPRFKQKKEWFEAIIYILGVYGESKLYDFIVRDPEYQDNIARNSIRGIRLGKDSKTINTLLKFKDAFVKTLGKKGSNISNKRYLELYFEYLFSTILVGEI